MRGLLFLVAALAFTAGVALADPDANQAIDDLGGDGGVSGALADLGLGDAGQAVDGLSSTTAESFAALTASVTSAADTGLFTRVTDATQVPTPSPPPMPETSGPMPSVDAAPIVLAAFGAQSDVDAAVAGAVPAEELDAATAVPLSTAHGALLQAQFLGGLVPEVRLPAVPALPGVPMASPSGAPHSAAGAGFSAGRPTGVPGRLVADAPTVVEQLRFAPAPASPAQVVDLRPGVGLGPLERATATLLGPAAAVALIAPAIVALIGGLLFAPSLYHRVHQEASLDHPGRRALYDAIMANPGCTIQSAARAAGLSRGTAVHHLRILARHRLVLQRPGTKEVHLFPNTPGFEGALGRHLALLARPRTREVAATVASSPGLTRTEVAARVGITPSTLDWHLGQLLACGLLSERLDGRRRALIPGEGLAAALARVHVDAPMVVAAPVAAEAGTTMPPA